MESSIKALYIGRDLEYWELLKQRFTKIYPQKSFQFIEEPGDYKFNPEVIFETIYKSKINMIFIDFSLSEKKCLRLAKLLRKNQLTRRISTTALFEYLHTPELISRSLMAGILLNQVKGIEITNVVYDAFTFYSHEEAIEPEVTLVEMEQDEVAIQDLRLAYATTEYFRVETNNYFNKDQLVTLCSHPLNSVMKTNKFRVSQVDETDLYFDSRYGINLDYIYSNFNLSPAELAKENIDVEMKDEEKEELLQEIKENITKWFSGQQGRNKIVPKKTKLLIIDQDLDCLSNPKENFDRYPFSIELQTSLRTKQITISRRLPHIITYCLKEEGESLVLDNPKFFNYNDHSVLEKIVQNIKEQENYQPILVIFNSKESSEKLQVKYQYSKIMAYRHKIDMNIIVDFATIHQKHLDSINREILKNQIYYASTDPNSVIQMECPIKLLAMSEVMIYFISENPIREYTVFKLNSPIPMMVTVVPMPSQCEYTNTPNCYKALITNIKELEKNQLRNLIRQKSVEEKDTE